MSIRGRIEIDRITTDLSLTSSQNSLITDNEFISMIEKLPNLRSINLKDSLKITEKGLEAFKGLTHLTKLNLFNCEIINDKGLMHF